MKTVISLLFVAGLLASCSSAPKKSAENSKVNFRREGNLTRFHFSFTRTRSAVRGTNINLTWTMPAKESENFYNNFGVPASMYQAYYAGETEKRDKIMSNGYFHQTENTVEADQARIIRETGPIFDDLIAQLKKNADKPDDFRSLVELTLSFVQNIPYKVPPQEFRGKFINGQFHPVQVLFEGYGDCDSKALLFLTILNRIRPGGYAILNIPNHVFTGIRMEIKPGDVHFTSSGQTYILAESAGPGNIELGRTYDAYEMINDIEFF